MNPNATTFVFNPNASSFVPKTFSPPAQSTSPAQEKKSDPAPMQVEDSWETNVDKPTSPSVSTKEIEKKAASLKIDDEAIKKELQRMAAEEGVTEEELLKADKADGKDASGEGKEELVEEAEDPREHINIVFIGHVDAGKSTISGSLLYITGQVDLRTIQKYEKEAKDNHRESWFLAYIMDTNEEERKKGKTVEVGRADFETKAKRYTILDAPGHKAYVPNMIGGASQADIGVLVISAKKGEFESGFSKGGQTKEHTMLAKTLGIKYLVVVINKMDDASVNWEKERYDEIVNLLNPYFRQCGYAAKDVAFIPISGLKSHNLSVVVPKDVCNWYEGGTLLDLLDNLKPIDRLNSGPLRIPITDKFKDRGITFALGKVESGVISKGDQLVFVPNKIPVEVLSLSLNETSMVRTARAGENIKIGLRGVDEDQIHRGYVLCDKAKMIPCQTKFEAQLAILELLPHKSIFCAGYTAIIHIHTAVEEITITVRTNIFISSCVCLQRFAVYFFLR
eukprot:TRINITY_DN514_c0_g1_i3.p1 TRINITY_DN514_c0_g1~~TRINITY_DN514_c0_g1_i3.p1  ORF type:complete len:546 (-),score=161.02 TRINITY_DN514_c0_g1_i3:38-1561(-)